MLSEKEKKKRHNEANKKWREKNLEAAKKKSQDWKKRNSEKVKDYYLKNKDKFIASAKKWKKNNPIKYKKSQLKYEQTNEDFKKKKRIRNITRRKIEIPPNTICQVCKKNKATDRHHKDYSKPLEAILCCKDCHNILDHSDGIQQ